MGEVEWDDEVARRVLRVAGDEAFKAKAYETAAALYYDANNARGIRSHRAFHRSISQAYWRTGDYQDGDGSTRFYAIVSRWLQVVVEAQARHFKILDDAVAAMPRADRRSPIDRMIDQATGRR
jgi:hypothetical protein